MRIHILFICFCLSNLFLPMWGGTEGEVSAQVPYGIHYQAVARDAANAPLSGANITVRFSVYNSNSGDTVWIETHSKTTSAIGLFEARIGMGTKIGGSKTNFSDIGWGGGGYYVHTWIDNSYLGATQLLSVPYAIYADSAKYVKSGSIPAGTSGQTIRHTGAGWAGSSLLFNNGTTIGVNTTNPSALTKFHTVYDSGPPLIWGSSTTNYGSLEYIVGTTRIKALGTNKLGFGGGNGNDHMLIDASGNVGIGITNPNNKLQVEANNTAQRYAGQFHNQAVTGPVNVTGAVLGYTDANSASGVQKFGGIFQASEGAGTNYGIKGEAFNGTGTNIGGYFAALGGANSYAAIFNQGNVGIGTTTPTSKLHLHEGHLKSSQTNAPAFAVVTLGGFTSFTLNSSSTDVKGKIEASGTSQSPGSSATVRVTFDSPYNTAPVVVVIPADATSAQSTAWGCAVNATANDFTLYIRNNTTSGASGNVSFNYMVIE